MMPRIFQEPLGNGNQRIQRFMHNALDFTSRLLFLV